ncbi:MAG: TetR/AcrR family transcriptional regulator [Pseudomonadota bacterium]
MSSAEARDRVLEEAERLFRTLGYGKTTMGDIADACGFSASNVHRLFKTKSAVNEAIAARLISRLEGSAVHAVEQGSTAEEKLRLLLKTLHDETRRLWRDDNNLYAMVTAGVEENWLAIRAYKAKIRFLIEQIVDQSANGPIYGDTAAASAEVIYQSAMRLFHPLIVVEFDEQEPQLKAETLIEFLVGLLGER